jgi:hypothetical protein
MDVLVWSKNVFIHYLKTTTKTTKNDINNENLKFQNPFKVQVVTIYVITISIFVLIHTNGLLHLESTREIIILGSNLVWVFKVNNV